MTIQYNGKYLELEFGCRVFRTDSDRTPARIQEAYEVPGRSGDLLLDGKRYPNVEMDYTAVFFDTETFTPAADERCRDFLAFLASTVGYQRLTDSDHPGEFYKAAVLTDLEPEYSQDRKMAKVEFTLTRKPQRWLTIGETRETYSSRGTTYALHNPTRFPARPLIRIVGPGTVTIGATTITVLPHGHSFVDIDCEAQECYFETMSMNSYVELSGYDFPTLTPGSNSLTFAADVTKVQVTPRWWTI